MLLGKCDCGVEQFFIDVFVKGVLLAYRDGGIKKFFFVERCLLKTCIPLGVLQPRLEEGGTKEEEKNHQHQIFENMKRVHDDDNVHLWISFTLSGELRTGYSSH